MDLAALQQQAATSIERFEAKAGARDNDEMLFLYMSRISEDIGNLAASVLGKETDEGLVSAFAETLHSIIMLAQKMNIDLHEAIRQRMQAGEEEEPLL